jgi:hypothetical protein
MENTWRVLLYKKVCYLWILLIGFLGLQFLHRKHVHSAYEYEKDEDPNQSAPISQQTQKSQDYSPGPSTIHRTSPGIHRSYPKRQDTPTYVDQLPGTPSTISITTNGTSYNATRMGKHARRPSAKDKTTVPNRPSTKQTSTTYNRQQRLRMGGSTPDQTQEKGTNYSRILERLRETRTHKLERNINFKESDHAIQLTEDAHNMAYRQHDIQSHGHEIWNIQVPSPQQNSDGPAAIISRQVTDNFSLLCPEQDQHGRLTLPSESHEQLADESTYVENHPKHNTLNAILGSVPIPKSSNLSTTTVSSPQRPEHPMEVTETSLSFSTTSATSGSHLKTIPGPNKRGADNTNLADQDMVVRVKQRKLDKPRAFITETRTSPRLREPSDSANTHAHDMVKNLNDALTWKTLSITENLSTANVALITKKGTATEKHYRWKFNVLRTWATNNNRILTELTIDDAISFLNHLITQNMAYGTIKGFFSFLNITNIGRSETGLPFSETQAAKHAYTMLGNAIPKELSQPLASLHDILTAIDTLPSDTPRTIAGKAATIIMLCLGCRPCEVAVENIIPRTIKWDTTSLSFDALAKEKRSGQRVKKRFTIQRTDSAYCPITAYATYREFLQHQYDIPLTRNDSLFYCLQRQHQIPSKTTISNWVREFIHQDPSLSSFTTYDLRSIITSATNTSHDLTAALDLGHWNNAKTFLTHYWVRKDTVTAVDVDNIASSMTLRSTTQRIGSNQ